MNINRYWNRDGSDVAGEEAGTVMTSFQLQQEIYLYLTHIINILMRPVLLTLLLLFTTQLLAKDYSYIPYRKGTVWGYCNAEKKILIEPRYERAYWFADNGLARVLIKGKYGYIDKKGKLKIDAKFEKAEDFSFSRTQVQLNGKKYCLDEKGELTPTESDNAFDCAGLFTVGDESSICTNCCTVFQQNGLYGMVCRKIDYNNALQKFDTTAMDSIPAQYESLRADIGYDEDFMPLVARKSKFGLITAKDKIIYDFEYDSIDVISYNIFLLKKDGEWSMRDTSKIFYSGFSEYKSYIFNSGYYIVIKKGDLWGVLNNKGVLVAPIQFEEIGLPDRMIISREFTVKLNGKWGYISDKGNIAAVYDKIEPFNGEEYTQVQKNAQEGYINRKGVEYFE